MAYLLGRPDPLHRAETALSIREVWAKELRMTIFGTANIEECQNKPVALRREYHLKLAARAIHLSRWRQLEFVVALAGKLAIHDYDRNPPCPALPMPERHSKVLSDTKMFIPEHIKQMELLINRLESSPDLHASWTVYVNFCNGYLAEFAASTSSLEKHQRYMDNEYKDVLNHLTRAAKWRSAQSDFPEIPFEAICAETPMKGMALSPIDAIGYKLDLQLFPDIKDGYDPNAKVLATNLDNQPHWRNADTTPGEEVIMASALAGSQVLNR